MMKNLLLTVVLFLCGQMFASPAFLTVEDSGEFTADGLRFRLSFWDREWRNSLQSGKSIQGTPARDAGSFSLNGIWQVVGGKFALTETIRHSDPNGFDYRVSLRSDAAIACNSLSLDTRLPIKDYLTRPILADGKRINFGAAYQANAWSVDLKQVKKLVVPTAGGTLEISGDFALRLQDDRRYDGDSWGLRIKLRPDSGMVKEASTALSFVFRGARDHFVDLRPVVNMGFKDEVADDGKGGWTDQGPANDLASFPVGQGEFGGIRFDVIDPAKNNSKSCIVLRGKARPHFPVSAEVVYDRPVAAKYLYILNALGWESGGPTEIGTISCEYADAVYVDKEVKHFSLISGVDVANFWDPRSLKNGSVAWKHENPSATIGLYLTRVELSGKPVKRITFESSGNAVWMIVGATLSDRRIDAKVEEVLVMKADRDWLPLKKVSEFRQVKPGGILDFSQNLDAPAGKYGFARATSGGKMEFEKQPGVFHRFYGANLIGHVNVMAKPEVDRMVDEFAAVGYNIVRFHHFDNTNLALWDGKALTLNLEVMDKLDYTLHAFRQRGIYNTIDLFMSRPIRAGELPDFPDRKFSMPEYKALIFVNKGAMENFKTFGAQFLNHVNPYTGVAWKEDPSILYLSFINEDTIYATVDRSEFVKNIYEEKFETYLKEKNITVTKETRAGVWRRFLAETHREGYLHIRDYFRTLGVKIPVTDQNFWGNIATTLLRNDYDIVDNHFYWGHPLFLGKSWSLPAVVSTDSAIKGYAGGVSNMFPSRIFGKPFAVSEWDFVNPNPYNIEGAFLMGAYSALQDWDILCRFAWSHSPVDTRKQGSTIRLFDVVNDPLRLLSERVGVLTFLRGDVKPAELSYSWLVSTKHLENPLLTNTPPSVVKRLGLIGKVGAVIAAPGSKPVLPSGTRAVLPLENIWNISGIPTVITSEPAEALEELVKKKAIPNDCFDPAQNLFRSSTGELELNRNQETFQITTPRSEGFVLKAGDALQGKFASIKNRLSFAGVFVASMDDKVLAESSRILLLHLTDCRNNGMKFRDSGGTTIEAWGGLPLLIRRNVVEMTINNELTGFRLYACGFDGARLREIPLTRKAGKTFFTLDTASKEDVVAVYELSKE